jgi:hypothetical protein
MPAELLLEWVPKLQNAFENFGPTHAVSGFASRITDDLLYGLRVCGALLDKHSPEKLISADELTKFNTQAKELREEVLNSSIEKELKDFITSRLGDVIIAINAFPITGVAGLERSFERILGSMVNHPGTWEKVGSTSVGRKVFKYIKNLGVILTFAWTAFQIGDRVQHYLDDDASDDESVTNHVAPAQEPRSSTPRPRHKRNIEI